MIGANNSYNNINNFDNNSDNYYYTSGNKRGSVDTWYVYPLVFLEFLLDILMYFFKFFKDFIIILVNIFSDYIEKRIINYNNNNNNNNNLH